MKHTETIKGILSVAIPNLGAFAIAVLTNLELFLKIVCLSITIGYGLWKWIHDYKQSKKNK